MIQETSNVFLEEMTTKDTKARVGVSDFYKVLEVWCEQEGRQLYQMKTVGDVLVEKGFERYPYNGRSHWRGIRWAPEAADLVEQATGTRPPDAPQAQKPPKF